MAYGQNAASCDPLLLKIIKFYSVSLPQLLYTITEKAASRFI